MENLRLKFSEFTRGEVHIFYSHLLIHQLKIAGLKKKKYSVHPFAKTLLPVPGVGNTKLKPKRNLTLSTFLNSFEHKCCRPPGANYLSSF